jgi:F-type H+-transporting ATPase subunit b
MARILTVTLATALLLGSSTLAEDHPAPAAGASAADPHAAGVEHQVGIFEGGIGNSIITLIIFGLVVAILGRYAWPPLMKGLSDREEQIRGALEKARAERIEAEKLLAQYQQQIEQARVEATAIVEEGKRDAIAAARRVQEETRREADEIVARARREVQLASDAAVKELYDRTADLAVQIAGQILRKEIRADDHRGLVNESIERMRAAGRPRGSGMN